jgi:hypothetical protein
MKLRTLVAAAPALLMTVGTAYAVGGNFPGSSAFTMWEGWLTGSIAQWFGICLLVGLGGLIWLAHELGLSFATIFRGILALAVVVFAIGEYTDSFGAGTTITPPGISARK